MIEKNTDELEKELLDTHARDISGFLKRHETEGQDFSSYMRQKIREKGLKQQEIFLWADLPERYGYKLISGEKRTRQRDIILRICYAAEFTLPETQKALKLYELPQLYARIPRDAILMIAFNERPGSVIEVNALLKSHGQEMLRTSGSPE